jgi:hypothetical protein
MDWSIPAVAVAGFFTVAWILRTYARELGLASGLLEATSTAWEAFQDVQP